MSIRFSGECWISTAAEAPDLVDGRFGAGWDHVGRIDRGEQEVWRNLQTASRSSAGFYISVFAEDLTVLPDRFWLGVEWLTDQFYVASGLARPRALARRPPEVHPGLVASARPLRLLSAKVTAGRQRPLFERVH